MPDRWSPRTHYAQRHRRAANAATPAANNWLHRFGVDAPAANPALAHYNWRQNFAPGDFLPLNYDVEAPYVQDHMRRMEQRANRDAPWQPAVHAPNAVQVAIFNQPLPAAGNGALAMEDFLGFNPHVGVGQAPARPVPMYPVCYLPYLASTAVASGLVPFIGLPRFCRPISDVSTRPLIPHP